MSLPGISGIVMDLLRQDYSLPDILLTMESVWIINFHHGQTDWNWAPATDYICVNKRKTASTALWHVNFDKVLIADTFHNL